MDAAGAAALKKYIVLRRTDGFVKVREQEPDAAYDHSSLPLVDIRPGVQRVDRAGGLRGMTLRANFTWHRVQFTALAIAMLALVVVGAATT